MIASFPVFGSILPYLMEIWYNPVKTTEREKEK
jgi:hypothetical protein